MIDDVTPGPVGALGFANCLQKDREATGKPLPGVADQSSLTLKSINQLIIDAEAWKLETNSYKFCAPCQTVLDVGDDKLLWEA